MKVFQHDRANVRLFLDRQDDLTTINSIGWEKSIKQDDYFWDCTKRPDKQCLFQYTVSGEGEIEIEGEVYRLKPGQAFLIEIPGPFKYKLPKESNSWEFKYISFTLNAYPLWYPIIETGGRIIHLSPDNELLTYWDNLYQRALSDDIKDVYDNSSYAYRFMMELRRSIEKKSAPTAIPESVKKCVTFIESSLDQQIGLNDMAIQAGISKFHLIRLFNNSIGESPMNYLIKARVKLAAKKLIETDLPIQEITASCGFSNPNYFAKVFQKNMNLTPSDFRKSIGRQKFSEILIK